MPDNITPLLRQCLEATLAELVEEFEGIYSRATLTRYLEECYAEVGYQPAMGPNFLPVVLARVARDRLWAAAHAEGLCEKVLPELLFVCEHNEGRSQMAAVFAHHLANGWVGARSAGSKPGHRIEPAVVEAMRELDLDVALEVPKPLTDEVVRAADVVVTFGCGGCAIFLGKRCENWDVTDPAGRPLEAVRRIRYELFHRVWGLLETVVPSANLITLH